MFNQCKEKSSLPLERERVIRLMMSFNEPMVAAPQHPVQPTHAYICTFKEDEGLYVYVYLYLTIEKVGIIYRYAEGAPGLEEIRSAEHEAVQFAEEMGFLVDDLMFTELDISNQKKLLASIPLFSPEPAMPKEEGPEVTPREAGPVVKKIPDEEKIAEGQSAEVKEMEKRAEEKNWEPEIFLSKFRIRAAAERVKKK